MKESKRCVGCGRKIRGLGGKCRSCAMHKLAYRCRDCGSEITSAVPSDAISHGRCRECHTKHTDRSRRHSHPVPCSKCGAGTHRRSGICRACDGLAPRGKRPAWNGNPETCPICEGLPWRRGENRDGERVTDVCRTCGLPWEPEETMPLLAHLRGQSNLMERV